MGYRSDVGALFYTSEQMRDKIGVVKLWLRENLPFKDWEWTDYPAFEEMEDGYKFFVSNVKWYDTYPEIEHMNQAMEKFRELFCDADDGEIVGALEFIRIGESDDDVEIEREGDVAYRVEVTREICFE